jgi:long-chain acyl-CoA synthetase
MYDVINQKFNEKTGLEKILLDRALKTKLENLELTGSVTHMIYDKLIFNKTKMAFGGRTTILLSGSAPLLPHVEKFLKVISCTPFIEGYGQTESTGASFVTSGHDPHCGHVGGCTVNPFTYYRLIPNSSLSTFLSSATPVRI